jgi:hypothetical protein
MTRMTRELSSSCALAQPIDGLRLARLISRGGKICILAFHDISLPNLTTSMPPTPANQDNNKNIADDVDGTKRIATTGFDPVSSGL